MDGIYLPWTPPPKVTVRSARPLPPTPQTVAGGLAVATLVTQILPPALTSSPGVSVLMTVLAIIVRSTLLAFCLLLTSLCSPVRTLSSQPTNAS